jgi:hypothetical protein
VFDFHGAEWYRGAGGHGQKSTDSEFRNGRNSLFPAGSNTLN